MSAPCPALGLRVVVDGRAGVAAPALAAFVADLRRTLEADGLSIAPGDGRASTYVVTRDGSQATDADRRLILQWARRWAEIAAVTVSDVVDLTS